MALSESPGLPILPHDITLTGALYRMANSARLFFNKDMCDYFYNTVNMTNGKDIDHTH